MYTHTKASSTTVLLKLNVHVNHLGISLNANYGSEDLGLGLDSASLRRSQIISILRLQGPHCEQQVSWLTTSSSKFSPQMSVCDFSIVLFNIIIQKEKLKMLCFQIFLEFFHDYYFSYENIIRILYLETLNFIPAMSQYVSK